MFGLPFSVGWRRDDHDDVWIYYFETHKYFWISGMCVMADTRNPQQSGILPKLFLHLYVKPQRDKKIYTLFFTIAQRTNRTTHTSFCRRARPESNNYMVERHPRTERICSGTDRSFPHTLSRVRSVHPHPRMYRVYTNGAQVRIRCVSM